MKSYLLVMSGGAIGSALRFLLARLVPPTQAGWPWPTFAANAAGGLAMGLLAAWLLKRGETADSIRLFFGVGLLGGFTTFSAFSLEMAGMIERGQAAMAAAYALLSVFAALLAVFAGMAIGRGAFA